MQCVSAMQSDDTFAAGRMLGPRMEDHNSGRALRPDLQKQSMECMATLSTGLGSAAGYVPSALSNVLPPYFSVVDRSQDISHLQGTASTVMLLTGLQTVCNNRMPGILPIKRIASHFVAT